MEEDLKRSDEYNTHFPNMPVYAREASKQNISLKQFLADTIVLEDNVIEQLLADRDPSDVAENLNTLAKDINLEGNLKDDRRFTKIKNKNEYQQELIKIHSFAIILYIAGAWLVTKLAGCEVYGSSNCAQKELAAYAMFISIGILPILCSIFLNKITYHLLLLYSILFSILFFPIGTIFGIFSILDLEKYKQSE